MLLLRLVSTSRAVRDGFAILKRRHEPTGRDRISATLPSAEEEGHEIDEDERALMARALDEKLGFIIAQMNAVFRLGPYFAPLGFLVFLQM